MNSPLTEQQIDDQYRDDVRELLEAEGWRETAESTVVADNGALWTETNDALDSGVDAPDKSWSVAFDSNVPASVIAAVAAVAAGTDLLAEVRRLQAELETTNARVNAVTDLLDQQELAARGFEVPLPEWVSVVRRAVDDAPAAPAV